MPPHKTRLCEPLECDVCGGWEVHCCHRHCEVTFCTVCIEGWEVWPGSQPDRYRHFCPYCVVLQLDEDDESREDPSKRMACGGC